MTVSPMMTSTRSCEYGLTNRRRYGPLPHGVKQLISDERNALRSSATQASRVFLAALQSAPEKRPHRSRKERRRTAVLAATSTVFARKSLDATRTQ
jgi:hypothetical protein